MAHPQCATDKIRSIEQSAADAEALAASATARYQSLIAKSRSPTFSDEERAAAARDAETVREVQLRRQQRRQNDKQVLLQIDLWLREQPRDAVLVAAKPVELDPSLDDLAEGLGSIRREVRELRQKLRKARAAPRSAEEVKEAARAAVAKLAAQAEPHIGADASLTFAPKHALVGDRFAEPAVLSMLCFLFPEQVEQRLCEHADATVGEGALSREARQSSIDGLSRRMLELERDEEVIVAAALARGLDVTRRPDCDPRAILGVEVSRPKRAARKVTGSARGVLPALGAACT